MPKKGFWGILFESGFSWYSSSFRQVAALLHIPAGTQQSELLPAAMLTWRERSADGSCKIKRTFSQQGGLEAVSEAVGMQCAIS